MEAMTEALHATNLLDDLRASTPAMVEDLAALVTVESPSVDLDATAACAGLATRIGTQLLGQAPERLVSEGRVHLRWRLGPDASPPRVVLVGHFDTVWPLGTTRRWPFAVSGGQASGPGAFDMKAGIVQLFHALAALGAPDGVTCLLTSDEEVGSPTSRRLIEETVAGAGAALILEPAAGPAIKVGRKGVSLYQLAITGRAAHAGLEPELGANATVELAHQVLTAVGIARPALGTTVTPTVASAGTTTNTVPAQARLHLDVRAATVEEQERVDHELRSLEAQVAGANLSLEGGPNRPPFPTSSSSELFARAQRLALDLGLGPLEGVAVGGGSDGNFTAGMGVATLDGLGAVGGGAHAEGEHVVVEAMAERAALLAALVQELLV